MSQKNKVFPIPLSSFNTAALNALAYLPFNLGGFQQPVFLIKIFNNSNTDVLVSWDGDIDHDIVADGQSVTYNFQANNQPNNHMALAAKYQVLYVKGTAGVGLIYLSGFYLVQQ